MRYRTLDRWTAAHWAAGPGRDADRRRTGFWRAPCAPSPTSPAQVALAWCRTRSPVVHPLVGATRREQIVDSLAGMSLDLPPDAVARLDAASGFEPGFFADFIRDPS